MPGPSHWTKKRKYARSIFTCSLRSLDSLILVTHVDVAVPMLMHKTVVYSCFLPQPLHESFTMLTRGFGICLNSKKMRLNSPEDRRSPSVGNLVLNTEQHGQFKKSCIIVGGRRLVTFVTSKLSEYYKMSRKIDHYDDGYSWKNRQHYWRESVSNEEWKSNS